MAVTRLLLGVYTPICVRQVRAICASQAVSHTHMCRFTSSTPRSRITSYAPTVVHTTVYTTTRTQFSTHPFSFMNRQVFTVPTSPMSNHIHYRSHRTRPRRQPGGRPPAKDDEEHLRFALEAGPGRFAYVDDISCDIKQARVFYCDTRRSAGPPRRTRTPTQGALMAADILPTAFPRDASQHLSYVLLLYSR